MKLNSYKEEGEREGGGGESHLFPIACNSQIIDVALKKELPYWNKLWEKKYAYSDVYVLLS